MKASELIDVCIQEQKSQIVVVLPNGQRMATTEYQHSTDKSGNPVILIITGRKIKQ